MTWATPCDGSKECIDGHDEDGCDTPSWVLPIVLFGTGFLLWSTLLLCSIKSFNNLSYEVAQVVTTDTSRHERHLIIAILTELEDFDEIRKIFCREVKLQGNQMEAICFFKVN